MKKMLAGAAAAVVLPIAGLVSGAQPAQAANGSCLGSGYLCFRDYETDAWGNVLDDNTYWGAFGWNDRADRFENHGTKCNVYIFEHWNYGFVTGNNVRTGGAYDLAKGQAVSWWDVVSSNKWCNPG